MAVTESIYKDIATRTGGDIYIGVVGPVRTGKSTFIKRFMESVVLPRMADGPVRDRAKDEMPQSGSGKVVMTTEPKFVPDEAVYIEIEKEIGFHLKLIDCVGFTVPEAGGLEEDGQPRLVNTPWSEEAIPFDQAATLGTKKVIGEHSTVGIVVTTDGSIGEIPREAYIAAEDEAIGQMKETGKPFVILLNTQYPERQESMELARQLSERHKAAVVPVNCFLLGETEILDIMRKLVLEFPVREICVRIPAWVNSLPKDHKVRGHVQNLLTPPLSAIKKTGELEALWETVEADEVIHGIRPVKTDLGSGRFCLEAQFRSEIFYRVLSEASGMEIGGEEDLIAQFGTLSLMKQRYDKIADALAQVEECGYGIVTPAIEDLTLEEPEIVKQAGGYGVKLKASAPSIHMIRANIKAEISPIVGSESQSEDIVKFLLKEFEEDPAKIWQSNMFGKSLYELVNEGLNTKLNHMPDEARAKLGETLQKIINEGSGGLICIIL
ncbi:MAG: stage IV sporulation protein A [Clostridia bacterium]|nr:stage IV sporulation protein A [Clostridia bacterium]